MKDSKIIYYIIGGLSLIAIRFLMGISFIDFLCKYWKILFGIFEVLIWGTSIVIGPLVIVLFIIACFWNTTESFKKQFPAVLLLTIANIFIFCINKYVLSAELDIMIFCKMFSILTCIALVLVCIKISKE